MNEKDFNIRTKVIRETFNDTRAIKCATPENIREVDEDIYPGGDIFTTEDGDFIDLEFQMDDFNEDELVKYVELAEALYKKNQRHVSIYIICTNDVNVCVKECEIKSEADFTIKLACIQEDPCKLVLNVIKDKIKNGDLLNGDDIFALSLLPMMCNPKERNYYRKEYFRIMNRIS
ncbi:hypothetical protein [Methanobrevibacter sp.]|uniref:hypothetical protein n=1 Tax=Methanobrevibacter sp. TaxID=66852 RepID=UPI0025F334E5|nr:hypothetical protein [Methanobrevibacter sp.]MBQ6511419.1 hypothetical protein [Methanobrevibacter sp.]